MGNAKFTKPLVYEKLKSEVVFFHVSTGQLQAVGCFSSQYWDLLVVVGIEPRTFHMLGKQCTTELCPQLQHPTVAWKCGNLL